MQRQVWRKTAALAVGAALAGVLNCAAATAAPIGTMVTAARSGASSLPVGAEDGFPFGWVKDEGTKISLLPANTADVDQAKVAAAHKYGPFVFNLSAKMSTWPSACSLSSSSQLKSLFSGITGVRSTKATRAEVLGGGNTPKPTDCNWYLSTTFEPTGYTTYSNIEVSFTEVDTGSPSVWKEDLAEQKAESKKYPAQYAYYPSLKYGVKCYDDGSELSCLKDDLAFSVSGSKVTGGSSYSSDQAVWVDQVLIPMAEVVAAEVSTKL